MFVRPLGFVKMTIDPIIFWHCFIKVMLMFLNISRRLLRFIYLLLISSGLLRAIYLLLVWSIVQARAIFYLVSAASISGCSYFTKNLFDPLPNFEGVVYKTSCCRPEKFCAGILSIPRTRSICLCLLLCLHYFKGCKLSEDTCDYSDDLTISLSL